MSDYSITPRNQVRSSAGRARYDRATVHAIIDAVRISHVAFLAEGKPVSIPITHAREGERILLHGSPNSRLYQHLRGGGEVSISFAVEDGIVFARSAFHHAQNYRSAVIFGHGRWIEDAEEKSSALRAFFDRVLPGRWEEVRPVSPTELKVTAVAEVRIESASAKVRSAGAGESGEDEDKPEWHGVVELRRRAIAPPGDELPPSVRRLVDGINSAA